MLFIRLSADRSYIRGRIRARRAAVSRRGSHYVTVARFSSGFLSRRSLHLLIAAFRLWSSRVCMILVNELSTAYLLSNIR